MSDAQSFVEAYARHRPDVAELATVVSLAVQVEPGLLRRARLQLVPHIGVAAETDLWFGPLVESWSLHGFVLDPDYAAVLRSRLATNKRLLEDAHELTRLAHEQSPPTLGLEEDVLYAALREDLGTVGELMSRAVETLAVQPERTSGIARWAARAIPSMPAAVQDIPAARQLVKIVERVQSGPFVVGLDLTRKGVVISEPPRPGSHELDLGRATPRLQLHPRNGSAVTVDITPGRTVHHQFGSSWTEVVEIVTSDGRVTRLAPLGPAEHPSAPASSGASRRLVVGCDGTWDRLPGPTNVDKLIRAIASHDPTGSEQRTRYSAGASTTFFDRRFGQLFGLGMSDSIVGSYRFLVEQFQPNDEIYLLGGSRGATVARSLTGMIRWAGLLRREHIDRVVEAYRLYLSRSGNRDAATEFRRSYGHPDVEIRFLGVFDTVGPLGIPTGSRIWNSRLQFHDTHLPRLVRSAYQALAIDERRSAYRPTLWEIDPTTDQRIEQVWFAGSHGDIVGGYPDSSLSDIPLRWMADKLRENGLALDVNLLHEMGSGSIVAPGYRGPIHNSRTAFAPLLPPFYRAMNRTVGGSVASSVMMRLDEVPDYRPLGLTVWLNEGDHQITTSE